MSAAAEPYSTEYYRRVLGRSGGDLAAVQSHLALLRESGMSMPRIAELAGIKYLTVRSLIRDDRHHVTNKVADAVLAVVPGDLSPHAFLPRERADVLVARLTARGWTPAAMGAALGYPPRVPFKVQRPKVRAGTVTRLRALLDVAPPGAALADVVQAERHDEASRAAEAERRMAHRRGQGMEPKQPQARPDLDADWRDQAACHREGSTMLPVFFSNEPRDINRAKAVCRMCPVQSDCLRWALDQPAREDFGTAGGMSEDERVDARKRRRRG